MTVKIVFRYDLAAVAHQRLHLLQRPSRFLQKRAPQATDLVEGGRVVASNLRRVAGICERARKLRR